MTIIVDPKNDREAKVVSAFLKSLSIKHHTEKDEDKAMLKAMEEGRKSRKLTDKEQQKWSQDCDKGNEVVFQACF